MLCSRHEVRQYSGVVSAPDVDERAPSAARPRQRVPAPTRTATPYVTYLLILTAIHVHRQQPVIVFCWTMGRGVCHNNMEIVV